MARIVFMGTPEFAVPVLTRLIETQSVVGVVTQPDRPAGRGRQLLPVPVKIAAESAGLPIYQPSSLRSEEAVAPLRGWSPDAIIVAAFGQILRPLVLELPRKGCINVHASLLPRWRGAAPIQHAILAGDDETGISLMQMDVGLDTGPVFIQQAIPIRQDDTAATLHDRLANLGAEMIGQHLDTILAGKMPAEAQDDDLSTYAPIIRKRDGSIDWNQSSDEIERRVRAMNPWPGAFTTWLGQALKILSVSPVRDSQLPRGKPGQVVEYQGSAFVLAGRGGLSLERVQLAGKRPLAMQDFLRGQPNFLGSRLGE